MRVHTRIFSGWQAIAHMRLCPRTIAVALSDAVGRCFPGPCSTEAHLLR